MSGLESDLAVASGDSEGMRTIMRLAFHPAKLLSIPRGY